MWSSHEQIKVRAVLISVSQPLVHLFDSSRAIFVYSCYVNSNKKENNFVDKNLNACLVHTVQTYCT